MWLFGLSTQNPRTLMVIGAISLVTFLTIVIKKCLLLLQAKTVSQNEDTDDIEKCNTSPSPSLKEASNGHGGGGTKNCCQCCSGAIRTYALEELKVATSDFKIKIGVGATADVYLAELGDGRFGAVKRVLEARGGSKKVFLDEVSVLLRISHPNLVGLLGFCLEKEEQLLLLEYVPNKSLFDRLHTRYGQTLGVLSWSSRLSIARDMAQALDYLHCVADPLVIHRDVKSSNILLLDDNHAKLADFGLCKLGQDAQSALTPTAIKGSLGYVDVHYLNTGMVSTKSDVYSFGVLLLELITGLRSFQGSVTLPEWTEERRRSGDKEDLVGMLDPKLRGEVSLGQLREVVDVANLALLEDAEARPDITQILYRVSKCIEIKEEARLEHV